MFDVHPFTVYCRSASLGGGGDELNGKTIVSEAPLLTMSPWGSDRDRNCLDNSKLFYCEFI